MKWCSCIVFFITCTKCPPSSVPFWAEWKGVPLLKLVHYTPSAVWKPFKVSEADEVREQNHSFHSIFFFFFPQALGSYVVLAVLFDSSALWWWCVKTFSAHAFLSFHLSFITATCVPSPSNCRWSAVPVCASRVLPFYLRHRAKSQMCPRQPLN